MWNNGQDASDREETVRLYQPNIYSRNLAKDPKTSQIGGRPSFGDVNDDHIPICANCHEDMHLLLQLYVDFNTLYIFSCNRASCYKFEDSKFSVAGGGAVCCRKCPMAQEASTKEREPPRIVETKTAATSPWDIVTDTPAVDSDWNVDDGETDTLEHMLEQLEFKKSPNVKGQKSKKTTAPTTTTQQQHLSAAFTCYEIVAQQEPMCVLNDEDDVGVFGGASDAKIRAMLARYMEEEDDDEILAALRGGSSTGGGGGGREKDERLSLDDRALLTFTDRIKRAPRQVVRYAKGGEPLWSVPVPKMQQPKRGSKANEDMFHIPSCPCGSERIFECQLMPSLLHLLEVDRHAASKEGTSKPQNLDQLMHFENGGQNWGTIAVYTCPMNCTHSLPFVLVQDSVDGKPEKKHQSSMVVAVDMEVCDGDGDEDEETIEPYDGGMYDEPWSDDDDETKLEN